MVRGDARRRTRHAWQKSKKMDADEDMFEKITDFFPIVSGHHSMATDMFYETLPPFEEGVLKIPDLPLPEPLKRGAFFFHGGLRAVNKPSKSLKRNKLVKIGRSLKMIK